MIQVLSKKKNKPKAYPYLDPSQVGYDAPRKYQFYNPIEIAISPDGKSWASIYDIPDLDGVYCYRAPDVQQAKRTDNLKKIGLQDGSRLLSTTFDNRQLKIELEYNGVDETDAMLAFESAQRFFISRKPYWITFANWTNRMYCGTASMGEPNYSNEKHWTCEVTFTDLLGLSRSIGTSTSPTIDMWGVNNNMPNGGDYPPYTFTANSFSVYNLSDILIDPERRGHPLVITLEGKSNGNMKITNKTTGDSITRVGVNVGGKLTNSAFNGKWVLDGVRATLNGQSDGINCDTGLITLETGKNNIQIDNFEGKVTFDFPFWWLS